MSTVAEKTHHLFTIPGLSMAAIARHTGLSYDKVVDSRRRWKELVGHPDKHHTGKSEQIEAVLGNRQKLSIYEVCSSLGKSGKPGICNAVYKKRGWVTGKTPEDGDMYDVTRDSISKGHLYDVVDADVYGYPTRLIGGTGLLKLLKPSGALFLTWGGHDTVWRMPSRNLEQLTYLRTTSPKPSDFEMFVKLEALKLDRVAKLVSSVTYDRTLRQAWEITPLKKSSVHLAKDDYSRLKKLLNVA